MKPLLSGVFDRIQSEFSIDKLLCMFSVPVIKHVVKKNSRPIYSRGGIPFLGKSKELSLAEKYLTLHFKSQANKQNMTEPYRDPVWLVCHFYFKLEDYITTKSEVRKTLPDLDNLISLPLDCLQAAGVISNDSQVCCLDLSRRMVGNETKLEVFVLKFEEQWNPQLKF